MECAFGLFSEEGALLENSPDGPERFLAELPRPPAGVRDVGAAVMNCNPVTNGHLSLIRRAAADCGFLYVFIVEEDRSLIPFKDRLGLVRRAVEGMAGVCVCSGGPYMISAMTFPTYFLRETEDPSLLQSELDATLFGQRIAPGLGIVRRFAGQEPLDPVTRCYNRAMERLLPGFGVAFTEYPRAELDGAPISASRVRRLLREAGGVMEEVLWLTPPCAGAYLLERFGAAGRGGFPLRAGLGPPGSGAVAGPGRPAERRGLRGSAGPVAAVPQSAGLLSQSKARSL